MITKKDKNSSNIMGFVLNSQAIAVSSNTPKFNTAKPEEDEAANEDQYVSQLMDLVLQRMNDKCKSQTDVFRFIDTKGKGKVKRQDF